MVLLPFLEYAKRHREAVVIYLVTGTRLSGHVLEFDDKHVAIGRCDHAGVFNGTIIDLSKITSLTLERPASHGRYWAHHGLPPVVTANSGARA